MPLHISKSPSQPSLTPPSSSQANTTPAQTNTAAPTAQALPSALSGLSSRVNNSPRPLPAAGLPHGVPANATFTGSQVPKQADGLNPYDVAKFTTAQGQVIQVAGNAKAGGTSFRPYNPETHQAARHDIPIHRGPHGESLIRGDAKLRGGGSLQPEELKQLDSATRVGMFKGERLEEALLYYLNPYSPPEHYGELAQVMQNVATRSQDAMTQLMSEVSPVRQPNASFRCSQGDATMVPLHQVKPPTDRLGRIFSDDKLKNVLSGMGDPNVQLPPVQLKATPGQPHAYEVQDGIHRYYASLQKGYGQLPAVLV